ncbi:MAG: LamG-like jellyroll fold domain-containing protein [Solirubrobacteraceae bacterium]
MPDGPSWRVRECAQRCTPVGSGTPDTAPIAYGLYTSNNLLIGDYAGCSGTDFNGRIDEVKVFDRTLSPFEIGTGYGLSRLLPSAFPFDLIP